MDIQDRFKAFAELGAGWVLWLLVALSVVVLAVFIERVFFLISTKTNFAELQAAFRKHLKKGDLGAAAKLLITSKSIEARVVMAGLESAEYGPKSVEESLTRESALAKLALDRNLAFLGTVGSNAPFVGLLGTVIGIVKAFFALNESDGGLSATLMDEVGEALVATAVGILVALPAVAAYNFLSRRNKTRLARAKALGRDLMAYLLRDEAAGTKFDVTGGKDSSPDPKSPNEGTRASEAS